uniref:Mitochondrial cytochrome c oxidase subunit 6A isoform 2 n=1 Tax=Drosophila simulans TaxID=7240 RepID=A2TDY8_DROSI|nr:mitochondrial cytochrome c oxidase subunit 6A isoform 2 [Drosophila simulans]
MRHLQLMKYVNPRFAINTIITQRLMSKSDGKSSGTGSKDAKCKDTKDAAKKSSDPKAKASDAAKKATPPKAAKETKVTPPKDETAISGGSKCPPKVSCVAETNKNKKKKQSCDELLSGKSTRKQKKPLTAIQGGDLGCPGRTGKKPPIVAQHAKVWQKISLFGVLPMIAILTLLVFSTRSEEERLEFKNYEHMYRRTKRYWFKDGNRTAFHNSHFNALPPAGYEDEVDESGIGQEPETVKDKKARMKEFDKVVKNWRKHSSKRDAQLKKEAAAAEKEARKQEAQ